LEKKKKRSKFISPLLFIGVHTQMKTKSPKEDKKMKEVLMTTQIPREKGYLYYAGTDENGNLTLCRAEMARGKKKTEEQ